MTNTCSKQCSSELWVSSERKVNTQREVPPDDVAQQLLQNVCVEVRGGKSVPILRPRSEIEEDCKEIKPLGRGYFGVVTLVRYKGMIAVKKTPCTNNGEPEDFFIDEGVILYRLKGAGGAPRLLGLAVDSPVIIMSYCEGNTLHRARPGPNVTDRASWWLKVFISLIKNIMEIHALGCIHNDIHSYNVLLSTKGGYNSPTTHLIDFGVSMMVDQEPQGNESAEDLLYKVASPSADIIHIACIFDIIAKPLDGMDTSSLVDVWNEGLKELVHAMKNTNKMERPPLTFVYQELNRLLKFTTNQTFQKSSKRLKEFT
ncbi:hypothetical protein Pcinc_021427 [Petrolisthes cinctipes]|uniref:Protein kinase domain-containing protein n=1 Tax=Petrolisthes cinctipes TaxID=88211 RepID=A0AAE1FGB3_PETCI|nr:hypothetical protein Pcinc_021427 [Petrolisthes cinctipes]